MAQHRAGAVGVDEEIGPEPGDLRNFVGEIQVMGLFEMFPAIRRADGLHRFFNIVRRITGFIDRFEPAVEPDSDRLVGGEVQIGTFAFQQGVQI